MKKVILICDFCGEQGHDPESPSKECIEALKRRIEKLESKKDYSELEELIKKEPFTRERFPSPYLPSPKPYYDYPSKDYPKDKVWC